MSDPTRRIVITGGGMVCPLGNDSFGSDVWSTPRSLAIRNDRPNGDNSTLPFIARIDDFKPSAHVKPRKNIKLMSETITSAVAAASFAVDHAGIDMSAVDVTRCGVVLGSEMLYGPPEEITGLFVTAAKNGTAPPSYATMPGFGDQIGDVFPLWLLKYLPNMAACHIGIAQKITGPNNSIVQGNASSLLAIAEAVSVIERGAADLMFAGGTGTLLTESFTCNLPHAFFAQKEDFDDPAQASRPFDKARSGVVAGEGAGVVILEAADAAQSRGAKPLAEIAGFSRAFHRSKESGPVETCTSVQAIEHSIQLALADANCTADEIDHVNANATSQKVVDAREALAIRNTLGDVPVTALKSRTGHLGAGSGAIELAGSIWALQSGQVPPTLNYTTPDPDCPVNVITGDPKPLEKPYVLKLSQSTTGQVAAIVLRKCE